MSRLASKTVLQGGRRVSDAIQGEKWEEGDALVRVHGDLILGGITDESLVVAVGRARR